VLGFHKTPSVGQDLAMDYTIVLFQIAMQMLDIIDLGIHIVRILLSTRGMGHVAKLGVLQHPPHSHMRLGFH